MSKDKYKKHATNLFRVIKWVDSEGNVYETEQRDGQPFIAVSTTDKHGDTVELLSNILKEIKRSNLYLSHIADVEIPNEEVDDG